MHFLGIVWNNISGSPALQFRKESSSGVVELWPVSLGADLIITVSDGPVFCVGHFDGPGYIRVPCGRQAVSGTQCEQCRAADSGFFLPLASLQPGQVRVLREQPHFCYLNLFGTDIVKTGVAATVRKRTRVWEQGAHATLFFAAGDGVVAREIEEWISHHVAGVVDRVTVPAKARSLYRFLGEDDARTLLSGVRDQVLDALPLSLRSYCMNVPEYMYNMSAYGISSVLSVAYNVKKVCASLSFFGKILAVAGEILVLEDARGRSVLLNSKLLIGRLLEIGKRADEFGVFPDDSMEEVVFEGVRQVPLF